ncbi:hypothetical protein GCM10023321_36890 [Pseudonocardia eucalypti]|uniref:Uncharacterized protein n=1 Tax=Pseudonocardia eucalypti TaxID=648755 RepID=A0ABP9Q7Z8_9PSEU
MAYAENDPVSGAATANSASIRITNTINTPTAAYTNTTPGPVALIAFPLPTNKPAPITPPIPIIVNCRLLNAAFKPPETSSVGACTDMADPLGQHTQRDLHDIVTMQFKFRQDLAPNCFDATTVAG